MDTREIVQNKIMGRRLPVRADNTRGMSELYAETQFLKPPSPANKIRPIPLLNQ
jgi:hypothetical protein